MGNLIRWRNHLIFMRIPNAEVRGGRLLVHKFNIPSDDLPYFKSNKFLLGFDTKIGKIDQSLLNIPLVSSIVTYFWMMNKNLEVEVLDEEYVKNLLKLQRFFADTYQMDITSELVVKKTVTNDTDNKKPLLFFSGGLDSTYSLHDNLDRNPLMLMICGYDMYMQEGVGLELREKWRRIYKEFAKNIRRRIVFTYTNSRWILNEEKTQSHSPHRKIKATTYWGYMRHGVCLTGLAAPLADRFGYMITSANGRTEWDTTTYDNPFATGVNVDPMYGYAGRRNHYHGAVDRFLKAEKMREFLNSGVATLRVCYKPTLKLNCMTCEKCLRTLSQLAVAGVDPSRCGMQAKRIHWSHLVDMFRDYKIKPRRVGIHFKPMKKYIIEKKPVLLEDSTIFFDWLIKTDLDKYLREYEARHPAA